MKLDEQLKRIKDLLIEQSESGGSGGGTSTNSSGQYMSARAWAEDGILTSNGREEDIGELPIEIDITGGDIGGFSEIDIDITDIDSPEVSSIFDAISTEPIGDEDELDGPELYVRDEEVVADEVIDVVPCCEPCGDGMWKKCDTDDCIYGSISDCELVDQEGESNLESLSLSDIWSDQ